MNTDTDDELDRAGTDGADGVDGFLLLIRLLAGRVAGCINPDQEAALRSRIEPGWQEGAACASADPEAWFPGKGDSSRLADAICAGCPVNRSCLASAVLHAEHGVWAGSHPRDRGTVHAALRTGADAIEALDGLADLVERRRHRTRRYNQWSGKPASESESASGPEAA